MCSELNQARSANCARTQYIYCGLENASANPPIHFWPVLSAVYNSVSITPNTFTSPYKLIFSSKTAIDFFFTEVFKKNSSVLNNCDSIYFVGKKSKLHFEKVFFENLSSVNMNECNLHSQEFQQRINSLSLFSSSGTGMKNMIDEFNLVESELKCIFFTALIGRSKTIIESLNFVSEIIVIPIYRLIAYQSDFLQTKFPGIFLDANKKIIFECRSGQIFEQTVIFLMEYFGCHDILGLPKNIHFSCFGKSTFDKASEFYAK